MTLGTNPGEVVGDGREVYFDASTADFYAIHSTFMHRNFLSVLVTPKDNSGPWVFFFATPDYARDSSVRHSLQPSKVVELRVD